MHWHASNSQNFVKDMQCFAVVDFTAFESNHTADTGLQSFQPRNLANQNATFSFIHYVLMSDADDAKMLLNIPFPMNYVIIDDYAKDGGPWEV